MIYLKKNLMKFITIFNLTIDVLLLVLIASMTLQVIGGIKMFLAIKSKKKNHLNYRIDKPRSAGHK